MEVKILEHRESEFVEHLKTMLYDTFHSISMSFEINYFVGEDTSNGDKVLCFVLTSSKAGVIYEKIITMEAFETPMDVEDTFVNQIVNDFILAGVTFVNLEKLKMSDYLQDKGKKKKQSIIYLN